MSEKEISNWLTKQIRHYIPLTDDEGVSISASFNCRKVSFCLKKVNTVIGGGSYTKGCLGHIRMMQRTSSIRMPFSGKARLPVN